MTVRESAQINVLYNQPCVVSLIEISSPPFAAIYQTISSLKQLTLSLFLID